MFYFITHNQSDTQGPFNVTEIIKENPGNPEWGNGSHYWGEPEIGYYLNDEEWAIRQHGYQLSDAGVDVIILDVTNDKTFPETYLTICKVFQQMRAVGEATPAIAFLASEISANKLWEEFYSKGFYEDLWFQWKGKPLLLYGQHEIPSRNLVNDIEFSEEITNFFNLKQSWAWTTLPWYEDGKNEWPWVDHFPQAISWSEDSKVEMIPVSVAQHPLSNIGRSFHNFHQPEINQFDVTSITGNGLYFQEQWDRALEVDPEFIFVTGWNEWSAGRQTMGENVSEQLQKWKFYPGAHLGKVGEELEPGDVYFIDQYNQEFSRDIEPMKGGHSDNYYYQLMANIRRYKGIDPPQRIAEPKSINISGDFEQWEQVKNVYSDHVEDIAHRKSEKQGNAGPYINEQGRNDILESRVAYDKENYYFYLEAADDIRLPSNEKGMSLLIDSDQNKKTGWEGYDYSISMNDINAESKATLKDYTQNGWTEIEKLPVSIMGNKLMISLPKSSINTSNFQFHWVDHPTKLESIIDLFEAGDNAPERRANFQFSTIQN